MCAIVRACVCCLLRVCLHFSSLSLSHHSPLVVSVDPLFFCVCRFFGRITRLSSLLSLALTLRSAAAPLCCAVVCCAAAARFCFAAGRRPNKKGATYSKKHAALCGTHTPNEFRATLENQGTFMKAGRGAQLGSRARANPFSLLLLLPLLLLPPGGVVERERECVCVCTSVHERT